MKLLEKISYAVIGLFISTGIFLLFYHGKDSGPNPIQKIKEKKVEKNKSKSVKSFDIVFYNVENLFDTIQDLSKNDNDFLPNTKKKWNTERYQKKIHDLARVIHEINPKKHPIIVGLCEIENKNVVHDLIKSGELAKSDYEIIHRDSPDERGIDVALIYKTSVFKPIHQSFINIYLPQGPRTATRDIVYVKGVILQDTIHVFFNHWPSRSGGQEQSEPNRIFAATQLKIRVDSLFKINPQSKIIIMGDMNDYPDNKSVYEILRAKEISHSGSPELINLTYSLHKKGKGTYFYKGEWGVLDNVIVSSGLLKSKKGLKAKEAKIFSSEWMLYTNKKGEKSPNRTYGGNEYYGGVSDHLPIVLKLTYK
ncbi:MAG: endonuclease/exonuclease/phosphatase family protein [Flavobacteriales bacterium]